MALPALLAWPLVVGPPFILSASPSHLVPESYAKVPSVSRRFLLHLYGCNENSLLAFLHTKPYTNSQLHTQSSKPTYGPGYTTRPSRLPVAFANLNMNPHLPDRPGRPGILLTRREDVLFGSPTALFVCRGVNVWQYVGDYVSRRVRPVTGDEFCAMGYEVQRTWARSICTKKKPQCWGDMRTIVFGGNAQPRKDKLAEDEMLLALRDGKAVSHLPRVEGIRRSMIDYSPSAPRRPPLRVQAIHNRHFAGYTEQVEQT